MDVQSALQDLQNHIEQTKSGHYVTASKIETIDYLASLGILEPFCRANVIKYLTRQIKTKNKTDLLKAAHYILMLYASIGDETT